MIRANLRARLTQADLEHAIAVLGRGSAAGRRYFAALLADEGPDGLLDQPGLLERLRRAPGLARPSATLFLYVGVRESLRAAGLDDRQVADYLGALLLDFGVRDRAHRIADHDDASHRYLLDIAADLTSADGRRAFLLLAHLGNFALWLAGVFPDHIVARRARRGGPGVDYYDTLGARGFGQAAEHRMARELDLDGIYSEMSARFATVRRALNRLARDVLFSDA